MENAWKLGCFNICFEFSAESGTVPEPNKLGILEVRFNCYSRDFGWTKSKAEPYRALWISEYFLEHSWD
jgi:hypothetical protein